MLLFFGYESNLFTRAIHVVLSRHETISRQSYLDRRAAFVIIISVMFNADNFMWVNDQ